MFQKALSGGGGGSVLNTNITNGSYSTTDTGWYDTTIPTEDVLVVYTKSASYAYYGVFGLVNGVLQWIDGTHTSYDYYRIDTSGSTLKIGQSWGSGSQNSTLTIAYKI